MEYVIGLSLALAVIGATRLAGIERGRNFYPLMLVVVASYYVLFAAMLGSGRAVLMECAVAAVFMAIAVIGFRTSLWFVAVALVGHGLFDAVHHLLIANAGVPAWWPGFCGTFDVVAGGVLAMLLHRGTVRQEAFQHIH
jgi:hypothetical protein